jgi:hypothetical protein
MPFDHEVDRDAALVTVWVRDCAVPFEAAAKARELMKDPQLDHRYRLVIVVETLARHAEPDELDDLADVLKLLGTKFRGRKAIVATETGHLTAARIVALLAATHDDVEAFTGLDAARTWLQGDPAR